MTWIEASLRWYGLLVLLTLGWAPLVRLLCVHLADRGAAITRPLAILGTVYPSWLLASLGVLPYSRAGLWATIVVVAAIGWLTVVRRRLVDRGWLLALLVVEVVSLVAFAGYVWLRGFTPELIGTEKPMDAAFLASSALTATIPPPDPWFAGEPINYYYLGYLLYGSLARLTEVPVTTAFNLALATTFSSVLAAAAGFGFDAVRPWFSGRRAVVAGALAAVLLVGVGNLYAVFQVAQTPRQTVAAWWWDKEFGIGWRASRIVCDGPRTENDCRFPAVETINEFPFFSFLLGDLHPHLMALPFAVTALVVSLNLLRWDRRAAAPASVAEWARIATTGAAIGALYALNSWDYPTYLLIAVGAVWVGLGAASRAAVRPIAVLIGASVIAWLPFVLRFVPPTGAGTEALPAVIRRLPVLPGLLTTVGLHLGERTSAVEFLTIFGVPYVLALWLIGSGWRRTTAGAASEPIARGVIAGGILALGLAIVLPAPLVVLCGLPLAAVVGLLHRDRTPSARTVATALFGLGLALSLAVEFFYIRDAFDSRMNTLFKVYYQVWTLFAVAAALAVIVIWREAGAEGLRRPVLAAFVTVGLAAGMVYPLLASYQWTDHFRGWDGLDGLAQAAVTAPDEVAAIRWLQEHARPDDVVLEAAGCAYRPNGDLPFNRASAYSGVPTVIGWGNNHQTQWRSGQPALIAAIDPREADVGRMFAEPNGELIDRYGVTLLYVGRYERGDWRHECDVAGPYPAVADPAYPGAGWELAFAEGEVRIFRRADGSA